MKLLAWDTAKKKQILIGDIIDKALVKVVGPQHFMKIVDGYGIQEAGFHEMLARGVKQVVLEEFTTGDKWTSDIKDWMENGKVADYGHGKQRFLSLKFMQRSPAIPI